MSEAPQVTEIKRRNGVAGQFQYTAQVRYPGGTPGEQVCRKCSAVQRWEVAA